ncbi:MAG: peptidylprolyl isomerase [Ignavibacteriae bacterium]|nr:peptidylprolyl isomerase [Ignavibacteriota bacterium]
MPIMTRMRDSMPYVLFGLLIAFVITIVFEWGMDYLGMRGGQSDVIGSINGTEIKYTQFTELVKQLSDNQKAQSGTEPDENQMVQIREQVWDNLVTQHLVEAEVQRLGLTVTDQELVEWVRGDNPPEDLKRNFTDSTGQFRRDVFEQFLANPNQFIQDPEGRDQEFGSKWLKQYESNLRQRRVQEKLQSVILASVRVSEGELQQRYNDQTRRYSVLYAPFDAGALVPDADVQVTDTDIKTYYDENLDQYKVEPTRKLQYVLFLEKPSASDSSMRKQDIDDAAKKAAEGADFIELVNTFTGKPDSGAWFRHGELSTVLDGVVFGAPKGSVVGPVQDQDGFHLVKVLDQRQGKEDFVHASHILLSFEQGGDTAQIYALAKTLMREIQSGKDFVILARQYSKDFGSAQRGGDMGWFGKNRMVPEFEKAAFGAKPGQVVGPIRTPYGLHIIKVHARDARELKLSHLAIKIETSSQTKNELFDRAKDFAFNSRETSFGPEAQQMGFEVKDAQIQEKSAVIPGIGVHQGVTRWAFKSKVGDVSEPYTIPGGYAVLTVAEIKDAGVRPLDELKDAIRPLALREKKIAKTKVMADEVRAKLAQGDSLRKVTSINPAIPVQEIPSFTLGGMVPGVGREPSFLGTVASLQPGQISPVVKNTRGAFLVQLLTVTPFDSSAYNMQRDMIKSRLLQEKRNRFLSDWLTSLKEKADIEDHRDQFFR